MLAAGSYGAWRQYHPARSPAAQTDDTVIISKVTPEETAVSGQGLGIGPTEPRKISLPTLGAGGFLQKIGLDQFGGISTPDNIHTGGWYVHEARPGEPGLGIINGYVAGKTQDGIFKNLDKLRPGDRFSIELGNLTLREFEVVRVTTQSVAATSEKLLVQEPGVTSQLNLMTCGRDSATQVLVVSKLI